jgi:hypothetical protein
MAEPASKDGSPTPKRDRSPQFPYLGLGKALERLAVINEKAKRHDVRVADIAGDWKLSPKSSSTDRNVAALIAYGLVEESGSGDGRKIKISDTGWRILEDQRPGIKESLLAEAALKPPIIWEYAQRWGDGRPDDSHALSLLKFEGGFTDDGAAQFLRVFDETMGFTKGREPAKNDDSGDDVIREVPTRKSPTGSYTATMPGSPPRAQKDELMAGERELTTGLLSKDASFRLVVTGQIGVKEIERLIKKLELDKEILAEQAEEEALDELK